MLGFDTATRATAVALMLADGSTVQARDDPEGDERPGHATRLLPLADRLLTDAGLGWGEIERIAVGVGPGTFTGLRIGVATARGVAQSLGVELVGVSSLRALAHATRRIGPGGPFGADGAAHADGAARADEYHVVDEAGGVLAVIDARRGEVFAAVYDGELELVGPQALAPAGLGALRERAEAQTDAPRCTAVGDEAVRDVRRWTAVGDGAVRYREALEQADVLVPDDRSPLHRVDGRAICELGARSPARSPAGADAGEGQVLPDYRRRPDAEIALEKVAL